MSIPGKVLIALLSALLVAVIAPFVDPQYKLLTVFIPAAVAAVLAVVLSHRALPMPGAIADSRASAPTAKRAPQTPAATSGKAPRTRSDKSGREGQRREKPEHKRDSKRDDKRDDKRDEKREEKRGGKRGDGSPANGRGRRGSANAQANDSKAPPREAGQASTTSDAALEEGTVKWFNVSKGYGFIIRENGDEIFVHHRSVQGDGRGRLDDGSSVRFRVVTTDKGPQAEDVEPL